MGHTRNGGVRIRTARALCPKRVILSQCLSRSQCAMSDTFTPVYVCMCGWVSQCVCGCEVMNVCGVGRGWEVVKEFLHDHNSTWIREGTRCRKRGRQTGGPDSCSDTWVR